MVLFMGLHKNKVAVLPHNPMHDQIMRHTKDRRMDMSEKILIFGKNT